MIMKILLEKTQIGIQIKKIVSNFEWNGHNITITHLDSLKIQYTEANNGKIVEIVDFPYETYTQVEYIEGTGTQWIDTGLISSADNKIYFDIDFEVNNISGNGADRNPIGSQNFAFNTYFLQVFLSKIYMFQGDINTEVTDLRNKVKFYKTNWYVNDELKNSSIGYPTSNCNIYLFKWGNNLSKNKLYKCNFFDEGENLLREFIPCYRKSDNKPGLYDLVSGVFYTNQGTGEFTYGNVAE